MSWTNIKHGLSLLCLSHTWHPIEIPGTSESDVFLWTEHSLTLFLVHLIYKTAISSQVVSGDDYRIERIKSTILPTSEWSEDDSSSSWVIVLPFWLLLASAAKVLAIFLHTNTAWKVASRRERICLLISSHQKLRRTRLTREISRCRYFSYHSKSCLIVHCCSKWRSESRKITELAACHFNCIYMC